MSTELSFHDEFPATPAALFALITDTTFLQDRMAAGGGIDPEVVSVTTEGAVTTIVTRQSIPADALPSMVSSMLGGDPVTERTEAWQAEGEAFSADFSLVVKGAPASVKGTMRLEPTAAGTTLSVSGTANVPIPLFGSKLETTIVEQITSVLGSEGDYTRQHLG